MVQSLKDSVEKLAREDLAHASHLRSIADAFAVTVVDATHKIAAGTLSWSDGHRIVIGSMETVEGDWAKFKTVSMSAKEQHLVLKVDAALANAKGTLTKLQSAILGENRLQVAEIARKELYQAVDPIGESLDSLFKLQFESANELVEEQLQIVRNAVIGQVAIGALLVMLTGLGIAFVRLRVTKPIDQLRQQMLRLAGGSSDLDLPVLSKASELGAMVEAVQIFQQNLVDRQRLEEVVREERKLELQRQQEVETLLERFQSTIGDVRAILDTRLDAMQDSSVALTSIVETASASSNRAQDATRDTRRQCRLRIASCQRDDFGDAGDFQTGAARQ